MNSVLSREHSRTALIAMLFLLVLFGCFGDPKHYTNVYVSGYVRSDGDSTAIPGAMVLFKHLNLMEMETRAYCYTDSSGYYTYRSGAILQEATDPILLRVTVLYVDAEEHGIFVSQDTLLYCENPDQASDLYFEVDFHVERIR